MELGLKSLYGVLWNNRIKLISSLVLVTCFIGIVIFYKEYPEITPSKEQLKQSVFKIKASTVSPTRPSLLSLSLPHLKTDITDQVTIITAYFNLGDFQKGELSQIRFNPHLYKKWMSVFSRISNHVIAYFDDMVFYRHFIKQRRYVDRNMTLVRIINRTQLWSFTLKNYIKSIYEQPDYPVHHPNTVYPEYSCAMHAKYELLYKSMRENPFKTKYFAWLDIGLFRDIAGKKGDPFLLHLPPSFDESKVAYTDVYRGFRKLSNEQIFKANLVWVCGCFFIGRIDVMLKWTVEYMKYVEHFIMEEHLMNTDQQVIYAIHSNYNVDTAIQTYYNDGRYNMWFHLGYLCKE